MRENPHNLRFRLIMILLTAALIAFAFFHSSMPATVSAEESGSVLLFLQNLLNSIGLSAELTDHIVRKLAHFTEYAAIGAMLMNTAYSFNKSRPHKFYPHILFAGLMTAVIDEAIQLNVAGRSGQITDVLLDFSGILAGSIIMLLILTIYKKIRKIR